MVINIQTHENTNLELQKRVSARTVETQVVPHIKSSSNEEPQPASPHCVHQQTSAMKLRTSHHPDIQHQRDVGSTPL